MRPNRITLRQCAGGRRKEERDLVCISVCVCICGRLGSSGGPGAEAGREHCNFCSSATKIDALQMKRQKVCPQLDESKAGHRERDRESERETASRARGETKKANQKQKQKIKKRKNVHG